MNPSWTLHCGMAPFQTARDTKVGSYQAVRKVKAELGKPSAVASFASVDLEKRPDSEYITISNFFSVLDPEENGDFVTQAIELFNATQAVVFKGN